MNVELKLLPLDWFVKKPGPGLASIEEASGYLTMFIAVREDEGFKLLRTDRGLGDGCLFDDLEELKEFAQDRFEELMAEHLASCTFLEDAPALCWHNYVAEPVTGHGRYQLFKDGDSYGFGYYPAMGFFEPLVVEHLATMECAKAAANEHNRGVLQWRL